MWALYPESNQRTLEEMDMLFAADSPWVWDAEQTFKILREQNSGHLTTGKEGDEKGDGHQLAHEGCADDKLGKVYIDYV